MSIIFVAGLLFAVLTVVARFITIWIVDRTQTDLVSAPPASTVTTDKLEAIQQQLNSKVLWDSPDYEVLDWLEQKHAITEARATDMLSIAKSSRKRVIREKALYGAIVSGGAALITGGLVAIQIYGGMLFVIRSLFLLIACGFCLFWFTRYLNRLVTGQTDTSAGL
jgi:hypothetical protein